MANPGPAVTVGLHPQNVTSSQTLRVLAQAKGVNVAATGDTPAQVINSTNFFVKEVVITNANNAGAATNVAAANVRVYTGANATGTSIFGNVTLTNCTTVNGLQDAFASANATTYSNLTNLYVNVGAASANVGTVDVYVYGYDYSNAQ